MKEKIIHTILVGIFLTGMLFSCQSANINMSKEGADSDIMTLAKGMGVGWNAGNTLEAMGGETAWGNPPLNRAIFKAVKEAGFDTVRLPVGWSKFSDRTKFIIKSEWMERVTEVVNLALDAGLYVIINEHWDAGWIQPTYEKEKYVNNRLAIMWKQIAINFRDYDNRLLFAGTNEVMVTGDQVFPDIINAIVSAIN